MIKAIFKITDIHTNNDFMYCVHMFNMNIIEEFTYWSINNPGPYLNNIEII